MGNCGRMMDDLVKRLREEAIMLSGIGINRGSVDASLDALLADEAAAALEAKDAEIARLRDAIGYLVGDMVAADMDDWASVPIARAALQAKE